MAKTRLKLLGGKLFEKSDREVEGAYIPNSRKKTAVQIKQQKQRVKIARQKRNAEIAKDEEKKKKKKKADKVSRSKNNYTPRPKAKTDAEKATFERELEMARFYKEPGKKSKRKTPDYAEGYARVKKRMEQEARAKANKSPKISTPKSMSKSALQKEQDKQRREGNGLKHSLKMKGKTKKFKNYYQPIEKLRVNPLKSSDEPLKLDPLQGNAENNIADYALQPSGKKTSELEARRKPPYVTPKSEPKAKKVRKKYTRKQIARFRARRAERKAKVDREKYGQYGRHHRPDIKAKEYQDKMNAFSKKEQSKRKKILDYGMSLDLKKSIVTRLVNRYGTGKEYFSAINRAVTKKMKRKAFNDHKKRIDTRRKRVSDEAQKRGLK